MVENFPKLNFKVVLNRGLVKDYNAEGMKI